MAFDWDENANAEGGGQSEKVPAGVHLLEVSDLIYGNQQKDFQSRDGSPQVLVIFQDEHSRECSQMLTLNEKAGWVLAKMCSRCGMDTQKMTESGIEPHHFADSEFGSKQLVGRKTYAKVEWQEPDHKGVQYSELTFLHPEEAGDGGSGGESQGEQKKNVADQDIPF